MKRKKILLILTLFVMTVLFCEFDNNVTGAASDFDIKGGCLYSYKGADKEVYIPDGVTVIKRGAFKNSDVEKVVMPDSVVEMELESFDNCVSLKEIVLSSALKDISSNFNGCVSLEKIDFPENLREIGNSFNGCSSLSGVTFPDSLRSIFVSFSNCEGLKQIEIPARTKKLSGFSKCDNLEKVILHPLNQPIYVGVFEKDESLKTIVAHDGNVLAGYMAENYGVDVLSMDTYRNCDVNGDGAVELKDAKTALEGSLNIAVLSDVQIASSDFDKDGKIGLADAQIVLKAAIGILSEEQLNAMKPGEDIVEPDIEIDYSKTSDYYTYYKELFATKGWNSNNTADNTTGTAVCTYVVNEHLKNANSEDVKALKKEFSQNSGNRKIYFVESVDDMLEKGLAFAGGMGGYNVINGFYIKIDIDYADNNEINVTETYSINGLELSQCFCKYEKQNGQWVLTKIIESPLVS